MAGKMDTKVRIVKCPRCRKILAEPQDVSVYECGGCGTKLQAKKRNNRTADTTSQKPDVDSSGKQKLDRVVDQEAGSSSNQQSLLNSTDKSDQNSNRMDLHGEKNDQDAAKRAENGTVDVPSTVVEESSFENLKMKKLFDNQEPRCSSDESDRNNDWNDLHSSNKDQDAAVKRAEDGTGAPSSVVEEYSSENLKMKKLSDNQQSLINSADESYRNGDHNDLHSSNKDEASAKRAENGAVDAPTSFVEDNSSENLKMKKLFDDQEPCCSSDESDRNSDYNDLHRSNKDQDSAKRAETGTLDVRPSFVRKYSSESLNRKQLSDDQEPWCSSNQQSLVNSNNKPDQNVHNDPLSSTELSGHEDPVSSPEATVHNRLDQEQNQGKQQENVTVVGLEHSSDKQKTEQLSDGHETSNRFTHLLLVNPMKELDRNNDRSEHRSSSELSYHDNPASSPEATVRNRAKQHETEFLSCRKEIGFEESGSEFEENIANARIISDSDGGSKSSFRSMIAEKLLDKRQKKHVYLDEDLLSEDGSADLHQRHRFGRNSSVESMGTARLGGTSYHGYEGSVSSFDGNDDHIHIKNHIGSMRDGESVDSGNRYRFNRRDEHDHPLNGRIGKNERRSRNVRSVYGSNVFHENPRHRPSMIPENPKMERIELLKLVRELQDQLERRNISNPQVPAYHNHILNNAGRYGQRMAFSGEATAMNRRRDGSMCHHCCTQDRHFSAQLPRCHVCCNGPNHGPGDYHSPRFSGPSSPKHIHSGSEFSASDDHWQQNDVTRAFRSPRKKQYVRPIAGGSPWITCYRCFKVLQLPQSFLLFNKRYHSLRCGACMKVLNFTLTDGIHVSRYYPEEMVAAPPSSEAEDCDKPDRSWAGPVSCSDRSFEKSYSTETDRNGSLEFSERRKATLSRDPSGSTRPPSSRISGRRKTTSEIEEVESRPNGSWEFSEERRKATMSRESSGSTQPACSRISGRRTTTSEIEEVEPGPTGQNGSPLHWLMGYASPSKVIRGL